MFCNTAAIVLQVLPIAMMATTAASWSSPRYRSVPVREVPTKFIFGYLVLLLCNTYHIGAAINSGSTWEQCLQQRQMGAIGTCLGQRALTYLQRFEDQQNVTLFEGSLKIERDNKDLNLGTQSRSIVNFLDLNPSDFR